LRELNSHNEWEFLTLEYCFRYIMRRMQTVASKHVDSVFIYNYGILLGKKGLKYLILTILWAHKELNYYGSSVPHNK